MLLLNLGGPETLDDVQPFLYNLFADPDIIRLPKAAQFLQPFIATVISTLRAPKSAEGCVAMRSPSVHYPEPGGRSSECTAVELPGAGYGSINRRNPSLWELVLRGYSLCRPLRSACALDTHATHITFAVPLATSDFPKHLLYCVRCQGEAG